MKRQQAVSLSSDYSLPESFKMKQEWNAEVEDGNNLAETGFSELWGT